mmetsp:Transcript_14721/g.48033  ORF Transcript_14721/g.48033 Transcript_14721/m.48033 type:complete len:218 (-) Transcript_14721:26-679(-)
MTSCPLQGRNNNESVPSLLSAMCDFCTGLRVDRHRGTVANEETPQTTTTQTQRKSRARGRVEHVAVALRPGHRLLQFFNDALLRRIDVGLDALLQAVLRRRHALLQALLRRIDVGLDALLQAGLRLHDAGLEVLLQAVLGRRDLGPQPGRRRRDLGPQLGRQELPGVEDGPGGDGGDASHKDGDKAGDTSESAPPERTRPARRVGGHFTNPETRSHR